MILFKKNVYEEWEINGKLTHLKIIPPITNVRGSSCLKNVIFNSNKKTQKINEIETLYIYIYI